MHPPVLAQAGRPALSAAWHRAGPGCVKGQRAYGPCERSELGPIARPPRGSQARGTLGGGTAELFCWPARGRGPDGRGELRPGVRGRTAAATCAPRRRCAGSGLGKEWSEAQRGTSAAQPRDAPRGAAATGPEWCRGAASRRSSADATAAPLAGAGPAAALCAAVGARAGRRRDGLSASGRAGGPPAPPGARRGVCAVRGVGPTSGLHGLSERRGVARPVPERSTPCAGRQRARCYGFWLNPCPAVVAATDTDPISRRDLRRNDARSVTLDVRLPAARTLGRSEGTWRRAEVSERRRSERSQAARRLGAGCPARSGFTVVTCSPPPSSVAKAEACRGPQRLVHTAGTGPRFTPAEHSRRCGYAKADIAWSGA